MNTKQIVMYSGGIGSWGTAKKLVEQYGPEAITLLFSDTKIEDADLYRFLHESADDLGARLVVVEEGRTPWQVFRDVRFLGNSRIDPCSRILKRDLLRKWLKDNCNPDHTVVYVGFDWTEMHRVERSKRFWEPWQVEFPLTEKPYRWRHELLDDLKARGIEPPRLYRLGFPHNNCGGFCVKAGQAQFERLLRVMPERYAEHEQEEEQLRDYLGKDVAILRDRSGSKSAPLTMKTFREGLDSGVQCDMYDWGGCACFDSMEDDG